MQRRLPRGAEIRSGHDAIGRVPIEGPIGVAEKNGRRLSAIIRAVIKVIYGAVVAAVGNPNDAINRRPHAHLGGNIGPLVMGLRANGHGGRRQSGGHQSQCVSHLQTMKGLPVEKLRGISNRQNRLPRLSSPGCTQT
jgi:hypothetical protein